MNITGFINAHPWVPLIAVILIFAVLVGISFLKGKKGEIPIDLENPDIDKRRADVGSTESRIMPRD